MIIDRNALVRQRIDPRNFRRKGWVEKVSISQPLTLDERTHHISVGREVCYEGIFDLSIEYIITVSFIDATWPSPIVPQRLNTLCLRQHDALPVRDWRLCLSILPFFDLRQGNF